VSFQLIDKSLTGAMRTFLNLVGPTKRILTIIYPGPHPIGDAELDRFSLYATNVPGAIAVIRQVAVRKALLSLASVSLIVDRTGASFADPSDTNVYAFGASRTDVNPAPAIRSAIRVHRTIEELVNQVSEPELKLRATQEVG
jgi:hypothetical protein